LGKAALHARFPPHVNLWSCWVETTAHLFIVMISHSCFTSGVHSGYLNRNICLVSDTTSTSSCNHKLIMTKGSCITCMKLKSELVLSRFKSLTCCISLLQLISIFVYQFHKLLHCKDKILKFRNKYSRKRNIGVSVPISTFMRLWAIYTLPRSVWLFC
jgi:hypothetical protein